MLITAIEAIEYLWLLILDVEFIYYQVYKLELDCVSILLVALANDLFNSELFSAFFIGSSMKKLLPPFRED